MQKITPNLWCDHNAREMAEFYASIFPGSKLTGGSKYPQSRQDGLADFQTDLAGKDLTIELTLAGHDFVFINADKTFSPTRANSFFVNFDTKKDPEAKQHLDQVWERLLDGGKVLMELSQYPFGSHYGWVQDRFGYSWQLMLMEPVGEFTCIVPNLLFAGSVQNRAEEALEYYVSVFKGGGFAGARLGYLGRYEEATGPAKKGNLGYGDAELAPGEWLSVMDSGVEQNAMFSEAVSFSIACKDQAEIDYFWEKLSAHPESEQCGWCKDKFGVSWQIVPENINELMAKSDAFKTMMRQKKIVISEY